MKIVEEGERKGREKGGGKEEKKEKRK